MNKKFQTPATLLLAIIYMLFIISFSVILVLNFNPLYYSDIDRLQIEKSSGLSKNEIIENYDTLISYNSMFNHEELEFPSLSMSEYGKIHFEEVKALFVLVQYLCIAALVIGIVGTVLKMRTRDAGYLKLTAILTLAIPAVLGILIALNWDNFFVTFHQIFFNNDYWIFDPALDPIITILPDAFFMHCAIAILLLVVLFCATALFLHRHLSRHWKKA